MNDDLWAALRADAARHEPDRDLILARVEEVRPRPGRFRPLVVAAAAASVLVTATLAGWSLSERAPRTVASPTSAEAVPPVTGPAEPVPVPKTATEPPTGSPTGPVAEGAPPPSTPGSHDSTAGAAPGVTVRAWTDPVSGEYWAQRNLTVTVERPLTAFSATIRIGAGAGEEFAGSFSTLSTEELDFTRRTQGTTIVYRWTLRPGRTIRAGSYQLSAQFKRLPGPRPVADSYTAAGISGNF
ncbi:hypothetical protein [Actinocorallia longicatena]|uniref:Uncharacterized protein n=1 Tax=Actinocorallia longicatena TaxID=111803 RepID=A0ABP6PWN1_9ACTN